MYSLSLSTLSKQDACQKNSSLTSFYYLLHIKYITLFSKNIREKIIHHTDVKKKTNSNI